VSDFVNEFTKILWARTKGRGVGVSATGRSAGIPLTLP
jgi:hypothetical protein